MKRSTKPRAGLFPKMALLLSFACFLFAAVWWYLSSVSPGLDFSGPAVWGGFVYSWLLFVAAICVVVSRKRAGGGDLVFFLAFFLSVVVVSGGFCVRIYFM